jgi:hypothetical protein
MKNRYQWKLTYDTPDCKTVTVVVDTETEARALAFIEQNIRKYDDHVFVKAEQGRCTYDGTMPQFPRWTGD